MQPDLNEIQKLKDRLEKLESKHSSTGNLIIGHAHIIVTGIILTLLLLKGLSLI